MCLSKCGFGTIDCFSSNFDGDSVIGLSDLLNIISSRIISNLLSDLTWKAIKSESKLCSYVSCAHFQVCVRHIYASKVLP